MFRYWRFAVATMISEVYDAFISAGVPEDKARKTGTVLAGVAALVIKTFFT